MAIAPVSGSVQSVRTNTEPVKKAVGEQKTDKTIVEQENEKRNMMKSGVVNNQDSEDVKGVKEVDVKV